MNRSHDAPRNHNHKQERLPVLERLVNLPLVHEIIQLERPCNHNDDKVNDVRSSFEVSLYADGEDDEQLFQEEQGENGAADGA